MADIQNSKMAKHLPRSLGIAAVLFLAYYLHKPVDLRDESLCNYGIQKDQEAEGRRLLQQMAEIHGNSRYKTLNHYELIFTNTWSFLPGLIYRPWVENGQKIQMKCKTGESFTSETLFLNGKNQHEIWGVSDRKSYTKKNAEADRFYKKNNSIELWLSTFQFLFEIPFRTEHLHFVSYMGIETIDNVSCHKVFASWFNPEPSNDHDQIIFYSISTLTTFD